MIRFLLLVLPFALAGAVTTAVVYRVGRVLLGPALERRRLRQLAAERAETCFLCLRSINVREDAYDKKKDRWFHTTCMTHLLGGTE